LKHRHFLLYKPYGYLSQFTGERKKKFLGELYDFPPGTMAIGRLDEDSEGLLMLTTSGVVSEQIRSHHFEKEYHVQVDGIISDIALHQIQKGLLLYTGEKHYMSKPCFAQRIDIAPIFPPRAKKIRDDRHGPTSWVKIILTEGRNRQVRKMTAAAGFPTLRLIRTRIGNFTLDGMQPGEVKEQESLL
jgi:23S rRNA pseudouridine2457 synthase